MFLFSWDDHKSRDSILTFQPDFPKTYLQMNKSDLYLLRRSAFVLEFFYGNNSRAPVTFQPDFLETFCWCTTVRWHLYGKIPSYNRTRLHCPRVNGINMCYFNVYVIFMTKVWFCLSKRIASLPFSLPSPSQLLKLPIAVIQKFCFHGNVTSYFFSLFCQ